MAGAVACWDLGEGVLARTKVDGGGIAEWGFHVEGAGESVL